MEERFIPLANTTIMSEQPGVPAAAAVPAAAVPAAPAPAGAATTLVMAKARESARRVIGECIM